MTSKEDKRPYRLLTRLDSITKSVAKLTTNIDLLEDTLHGIRQKAEDNNEMVWRLRDEMDELKKKLLDTRGKP